MEKLTFTRQQRAVIDNRGGSLLVSAAAGTGKTRVLVERIMKKVADEGCEISDFLIITFTTAAAAELRGRIIDELSARSAAAPTDRHLRRQKSMAVGASIGTIHSFCGDTVREYAHTLGIGPDFRISDETENSEIKDEVLADLVDGRYEDIEAYPGFAELVDTLSAGRRDDILTQTVLSAHSGLQSHPYPRKWMEAELHRLDDIASLNDPSETAWGKYLLDEALKVTEYWLKEFIFAQSDISADEKLRKAYGDSWSETLRGLSELRDALVLSWEAAHRARRVEFPRIGRTPEGYGYLKEKRDRCKNEMKKIAGTFSLSAPQVFEDMKKGREITGAFLALVLDFDSAYEKEKNRRNVLDFNDLEHLALKVLLDPLTDRPSEAALDIGEKYDEVLVDEFQDINAVQNLIFSAITDRNLFMVGDVKQSIYRFRLADPSIFIDYYKRYPDWTDAEDGEPRKILLSRNFRSDNSILDSVNFVFQEIMTSDFCGMDYTEREYLVPGIDREGSDPNPVELYVLDRAGFEESDIAQVKDIEPRFVAKRVRELIDGEGYEPGEIVILLRSVAGKAWRYDRELKRLGIPTSSGGNDFYHTREIMALTSALEIIDNPTRDVPLIAAMSSPLFGFTHNELAEIRMTGNGESFFEALCKASEKSSKCERFIQALNRLRLTSSDMSVQNLLWLLIDETDALSVYGAMENGLARRAGIMRMLEYAGKFERDGHKGLFRFLKMFKNAGEKGKLTGPEIPAQGGGVQIMSVHSSKGLEFPVVILADMAKDFNREDIKGSVLIDPELGVGIKLRDMDRKICYSTMARDAVADKISLENRQEELRVLYVAMTRAEKKLIMTCSFRNAEKELDGLAGRATHPLPPKIVGSVKNFAEWVLLPLMLTEDKDKLGIEGSSPLDNVDWRVKLVPHSDIMGEAETSTRRKNETNINEAERDIEKKVNKKLVSEIRERIYFAYPHAQASDLPSKLTATEIKGIRTQAVAEDAESLVKEHLVISRPSFAMERGKLTGAERGTAIHLVMQYVDYSKCIDVEGVRGEVNRLKTMRIVTEQQAEVIEPQILMLFFNSALGQRVMRAKSLFREFKFSLLSPAEKYYDTGGDDEILLQGVVDCFFEEEGGLTIVDFKTDYVDSNIIYDKARSYAPQMEVYAYALNKVTGKTILNKYLYFFALGEAVKLE